MLTSISKPPAYTKIMYDGGTRVEILADGDVIAETIAQRGEVTRLHVALDGGAASVTLNIECEYAEPQNGN